MIFEAKFQIGKNGLTNGVINSLNQDLKTHVQIRIATLKAATRDKVELKKLADDLVSKVNYNCRYRIIGYTIILRRQSAKPKSKL